MSSRAQSWVVRICALLFACGLAYEPLYHLFQGSLAYSIFPQDDFYYYYLTAKNLALHGVSSFDGIVLTNGYHPLWLYLQACIVLIVHGSDKHFFIALEVIQVTSAIVSAELMLRLFRRLYGDTSWVFALTLGAIVLDTVLIFTGMETVLAVPLLLWFALCFHDAVNGKRLVLAGFVGALLILARLDTMIAIALAFILLVVSRASLRNIILFSCPFVIVALYLLSNQIYFHNWLPVSSQVKQLEIGFHFNWRAIEAIRTPRGSLYILASVIGLMLLLRNWKRDASVSTKLLLVAFPILFTLILALRMGWSAYMWYFYPFPFSATIGILEMRSLVRERWTTAIERTGQFALALVVLFSVLFLIRDIPMMTTHFNLPRQHPYVHAEGILSFTNSHPGRYAMGDRGGITAFVTHQPILQLEGLAADQAIVDSIRVKANLVNVLRKYGVRYYIVSYPLNEFREHDNQWDLQEPHWQQIERYVPVMRSEFFAPEVFRFPVPVGTAPRDSNVWVTRILDVSQAKELEGK